MSVDIAFQRLRDANPVPEPAALRERRVEAAVFLTGTEQRSRDMETADRPTAIKKKPLGWKWIPALVTAAVVIIAGASLLFSVADGPDVAGPEASLGSLLDDFFQAWDDQDVETAVALFTEDAEFDPGTGSGFSVANGHQEIRALFSSAMPGFRMAEADDLQSDGDVLKFNLRLVERGGPNEMCQRAELVVDNGKIGSFVVTVLSFFPCP